MKNSKLTTLLREPLLHFLLIGAALFLFYNLQNEGHIDNNRIVISAAQINHLVTLWEKKRQRPPTQTELESMIQQQVREEVMVREALAMGLDKNDSIIRFVDDLLRRLILLHLTWQHWRSQLKSN